MADLKIEFKSQDQGKSRQNALSRVCGLAIVLLVVAYTVAVLAGLSKERRIDGTTLGVIGVGILVAGILFRPDIFDRVTHVEVAGWKIEIEKRQQKQDQQLQDNELILAILLPAEQKQHLLNLDLKNTAHYRGSHALRTELRRLASINLIRRFPGRSIGEITDGLAVELTDYVELTGTGRRLVERLKQIQAAQEKEETEVP